MEPALAVQAAITHNLLVPLKCPQNVMDYWAINDAVLNELDFHYAILNR